MRSRKGCPSFQSFALMLFNLNRISSHFQVTLDAKTHGKKKMAKLRAKVTDWNVVCAPRNFRSRTSLKCKESKANTTKQYTRNIAQWTRNHGVKIWEAVTSWPYKFRCMAMMSLRLAWLVAHISWRHSSTKLRNAHVSTTNTLLQMNAVK